jgi:hypothetical protein
MLCYPCLAVLRLPLRAGLVVLQQQQDLLEAAPVSRAGRGLGQLLQPALELIIPYVLRYKQQLLYTLSR